MGIWSLWYRSPGLRRYECVVGREGISWGEAQYLFGACPLKSDLAETLVHPSSDSVYFNQPYTLSPKLSRAPYSHEACPDTTYCRPFTRKPCRISKSTVPPKSQTLHAYLSRLCRLRKGLADSFKCASQHEAISETPSSTSIYVWFVLRYYGGLIGEA